MKRHIALMIAIAACSNLSYAMRGLSKEEQEASLYGRQITIKNESDYPMIASVHENRSGGSKGIAINPHSQSKIMVNTGKAVNITANINGKTLSHNFHRIQNTENIWEVTVKEGRIFNHIEITRRISEMLGHAY